MSWLFLLVSLVGAWLTYNTSHPTYAGPRLAGVSFFAGWLTAELALHHIAVQAAVTLLFFWAGAFRAWPGQLGLAITLVCWVVLWRGYWRGGEADAVVERALCEALGADYRSTIAPEWRAKFPTAIDWAPIILPFPRRHYPDVERVRDIRYARVAGLNLELDVYRHQSHPTNCPTLFQVHGGGWVIGTKNEQAIPLMLHLAARGWVCVTADYRLSPHATFPDHLIDLKRALQWIREHGPEYGANPDFVTVTGGSAGGHLAALVALTGNDPEYQPGFEDVDTSVQGCVPYYGIYDFTNRHNLWHHDALTELLEERIMKASREECPEAYEKASPLSRVHAEAPPFFVIHGTLDTLAPVEEARRFVAALREVSHSPVAYAEIPGAQHAFELFPSLRTTYVIHGVERFLAWVYSQSVRTSRSDGEARSPQAIAG